jgi:hypothetical protein
VSTLASILQSVSDRKAAGNVEEKKFRVTLHRLARFNGSDHFQQITPYGGTAEDQGGLGRIFPVSGGIVGLACRTGKLVVCHKEDEESFRRIWELTRFSDIHARKIQPYVDALVACPFFAPSDNGSPDHVIAVLFADAAQRDFFDDDVLQTISAACGGFVKNVERLHETGTLRANFSDYEGYRVDQSEEINVLITRLRELGVQFDNANFGAYKERVTFRTVKSLDLELGAPGNLLRSLQTG